MEKSKIKLIIQLIIMIALFVIYALNVWTFAHTSKIKFFALNFVMYSAIFFNLRKSTIYSEEDFPKAAKKFKDSAIFLIISGLITAFMLPFLGLNIDVFNNLTVTESVGGGILSLMVVLTFMYVDYRLDIYDSKKAHLKP